MLCQIYSSCHYSKEAAYSDSHSHRLDGLPVMADYKEHDKGSCDKT